MIGRQVTPASSLSAPVAATSSSATRYEAAGTHDDIDASPARSVVGALGCRQRRTARSSVSKARFGRPGHVDDGGEDLSRGTAGRLSTDPPCLLWGHRNLAPAPAAQPVESHLERSIGAGTGRASGVGADSGIGHPWSGGSRPVGCLDCRARYGLAGPMAIGGRASDGKQRESRRRLGRRSDRRAAAGSRDRGARRPVPRAHRHAGGRRAAVDGRALARGPGLVRRRPLPAVLRHPQRPDAVLERAHRRGRRLPRAVGEQQRQHAGPAGPVGHLRAPHPSGDPDRTRRFDHGCDGRLRWQAAERAERRDRPLRRIGLVHRSRLGDQSNFEGDRAPSSCPATSTGSPTAAGHP